MDDVGWDWVISLAGIDACGDVGHLASDLNKAKQSRFAAKPDIPVIEYHLTGYSSKLI